MSNIVGRGAATTGPRRSADPTTRRGCWDDAARGEQRLEPDHYRFWPAHLTREMPLPDTSLYRNLEATAARFPGKTVVVCYGTPLSYRQFKHDVDALAGFLQRRAGVKRGDRVLLFMQNSPQFMIAFYAILRADAMVVPVNPMNLTEELRHYVADSDAAVAIIGQELLAQVRPLIDEDLRSGVGLQRVIVAAYSDYRTQPTDLNIPEVVATPRQPLREAGVTAWQDALAETLIPAVHQAGPDDLCVMPYTSGTTGKPKGCIHTHRTVMSTEDHTSELQSPHHLSFRLLFETTNAPPTTVVLITVR